MSANASVRDAIYQGLLNTLRVSIAGIVVATILGVLIGVARLSGNWVMRTLATVYVEAVRNTPLPLFVFFATLVIVLGIFPDITGAWNPLGTFVVSNRGVAVPWFDGAAGWLLLAILAVAAIAAWAVARWRRRVFDRTGRPAHAGRWALGVFVVLAAIGWFGFGFGITVPEVDGRRTAGGMRMLPSFFAIFFALVIYTASHIAEIVRGSIQAVPKGQNEAANALALNGYQRMTRVVLPQAMRIAIPPLGNQYLNLIKNSSLGAAIGYYELTLVTQTTVGNGSPAVPAFTLTMGIYIAISLIASFVVNLFNRRMALVER
jgi:general L-amino acid transport system permease protein